MLHASRPGCCLSPSDSVRHSCSQIRLVIVDSVTFHFRQEAQGVGERTRALAHLGQDLMALAGRRQLAVRINGHVQGIGLGLGRPYGSFRETPL